LGWRSGDSIHLANLSKDLLCKSVQQRFYTAIARARFLVGEVGGALRAFI